MSSDGRLSFGVSRTRGESVCVRAQKRPCSQASLQKNGITAIVFKVSLTAEIQLVKYARSLHDLYVHGLQCDRLVIVKFFEET